MSRRQRLDKLAKTMRSGPCPACAGWKPIRVFTMKHADDQPPAWPAPDDPCQCPQCGRDLAHIRIVLPPHAHPPGSRI